MNRLTTRIGDKVFYSKGEYAPATLCVEMETSEVRECMKKLATYEDTGLEPEEMLSAMEMVRIKIALDELKKYKDLEEQGLLIKLPCKVGDKIYVNPSKTNYDLNVLQGYKENNRVYEQTVNEIRFFKDNIFLLSTCDGLCSCHSQFYNITWFLTREEAEKALEGMK